MLVVLAGWLAAWLPGCFSNKLQMLRLMIFLFLVRYYFFFFASLASFVHFLKAKVVAGKNSSYPATPCCGKDA